MKWGFFPLWFHLFAFFFLPPLQYFNHNLTCLLSIYLLNMIFFSPCFLTERMGAFIMHREVDCLILWLVEDMEGKRKQEFLWMTPNIFFLRKFFFTFFSLWMRYNFTWCLLYLIDKSRVYFWRDKIEGYIFSFHVPFYCNFIQHTATCHVYFYFFVFSSSTSVIHLP